MMKKNANKILLKSFLPLTSKSEFKYFKSSNVEIKRTIQKKTLPPFLSTIQSFCWFVKFHLLSSFKVQNTFPGPLESWAPTVVILEKRCEDGPVVPAETKRIHPDTSGPVRCFFRYFLRENIWKYQKYHVFPLRIRLYVKRNSISLGMGNLLLMVQKSGDHHLKFIRPLK